MHSWDNAVQGGGAAWLQRYDCMDIMAFNKTMSCTCLFRTGEDHYGGSTSWKLTEVFQYTIFLAAVEHCPYCYQAILKKDRACK